MGRDLVLPNHQVVPTQVEYTPPTPNQVRQYFETFVAGLDAKYNVVYEHLAEMDREIKQTIDKRRKRTPKQIEEGDMLVIKDDPASGRNALQVNANGPMVFIEYTDPEHNAIRYFDP